MKDDKYCHKIGRSMQEFPAFFEESHSVVIRCEKERCCDDERSEAYSEIAHKSILPPEIGIKEKTRVSEHIDSPMYPCEDSHQDTEFFA